MFCAHGLSLCPINGNWQQIVLVSHCNVNKSHNKSITFFNHLLPFLPPFLPFAMLLPLCLWWHDGNLLDYWLLQHILSTLALTYLVVDRVSMISCFLLLWYRTILWVKWMHNLIIFLYFSPLYSSSPPVACSPLLSCQVRFLPPSCSVVDVCFLCFVACLVRRTFVAV